jgi:hypothetical protein
VVSATPSRYWGRLGHPQQVLGAAWPPHVPKGVRETTPKPPLGVVLAIPLAPWVFSLSFFFFFFLKKYFLLNFF